MYCEKISSRFWEIYHLIECHISLWPDFALSTVFFYLCFYERQADKPARPIGWLGSCERKYCLLYREKVSWKHFKPFWRNITSKIVMSWKRLPKFRHITWFCCLCFCESQVDKPAPPIGWLGSWERKYCLPGPGKYYEKISSRFGEIYHLIECHISLWPDFALSTVFFYLCFYERQADKPARPIGWLGSCERKYCLLCREKVSWKHFEPFWINIIYNIVLSFKRLQKFRHITWFFLSMFLWKPGWQTSAANWLTRFMRKWIVFLAQGKYYEKISSRFGEI